MYVKSSEYIECSIFEQLSADNKIGGSFYCSSGTNSTTRNGSSSSLSTGAKAGIGVGVGIGGLLTIIGVVLVFLRCKKKQERNIEPPKTQTTPEKDVTMGKSELHAKPSGPKELDGKYTQKYHLAASSTAQELQ